MSHIETSPQLHALKGETWPLQLDALYSCFRSKDSVLIMIDPDPDAMGSALALKRLLWHKAAAVTIGIIRKISRLNNLMMARLLRLPLVLLECPDTVKADKFVLVDSQPSHNDFFGRFQYTAVIDHHPQNKVIEAPFCDVRPDYGATSTIMTQYLRAAGVQPSQTIATALLYGIKTDTRNFERHTLVEDIDAFRYLYEFADHNILRKVEISDLSLADTKYFHKAFTRKHVVKDRIFAYLDEVPFSDILVEVAEFLLKIHDINWSIVSGIYQDTLIVCVRNDGRHKDAGRLVRRAFGAIGCAGGHEAMARAEIPLGRLREIIGDLSSTSLDRFVRRRLSPFKKY
jgi:nanoRNase/pAp phosphatase (c-di-AMP/oligoRNAs hydrolase)